MDSGNTAWMLTASGLVLLMTPGLAFFYGGLVRARNIISTIMYSFIAMAVVSIVWVLWGYSLAFGEGSSFIGDLGMFGLSGTDAKEVYSDYTIPTLLFVIFQMMFAIITLALITGAFVERFKFTTYLVFLVVWVSLVYAPIAHWVWGGGWLGGEFPLPRLPGYTWSKEPLCSRQALRTLRYISTLYIHPTFYRVRSNPIKGGGRYSFQTPLISA
jgi:Amt family ammonium transporter